MVYLATIKIILECFHPFLNACTSLRVSCTPLNMLYTYVMSSGAQCRLYHLPYTLLQPALALPSSAQSFGLWVEPLCYRVQNRTGLESAAGGRSRVSLKYLLPFLCVLEHKHGGEQGFNFWHMYSVTHCSIRYQGFIGECP